jgi:hypothetical protein
MVGPISSIILFTCMSNVRGTMTTIMIFQCTTHVIIMPLDARTFYKCMTHGPAHLHKHIFQIYDRRVRAHNHPDVFKMYDTRVRALNHKNIFKCMTRGRAHLHKLSLTRRNTTKKHFYPLRWAVALGAVTDSIQRFRERLSRWTEASSEQGLSKNSTIPT